MRILVYNDFSVLEGFNYSLLKEIGDYFSYKVQGAEFSEKFQKGFWDGRIRLTKKNSIPSGLLPKLSSLLKMKGFKFEVEDYRVKPEKVKFVWKHPAKIRDYQEQIIKQAVKYGRGIIDSSTGSGKSIIALRIAYELSVKTVYTVNTLEALKDTYDEAVKCFGESNVGAYGGKHKNLGKKIDIITMASLNKKLKNGDKLDYDCLIIDEVHRSGANTWYDTANSLNCYYKFGLTGTNFRTDNSDLRLKASTGSVLGVIKATDLQDKGFLVNCEIDFVEITTPKISKAQYEDVYTAGIVENEDRNNKVCELVRKHLGKSMLILVNRIEHANRLFDKIKLIDPKAVIITGTSKDRDVLKDNFTNGEIKTVIASKIYNESANIPMLEIVINASGGKSGIATIQKLGRVLRTYKGKNKAYFYDFYDSFHMTMEVHSNQRINFLRKEGHKINIIEEKNKTSIEDLIFR